MTDHEYDAGMAVLSATERIARLAGFTGALETLPQWVANQIDAARSARELLASTERELRDARKAHFDAHERAAQLDVELSAEKRSRAFVEGERDQLANDKATLLTEVARLTAELRRLARNNPSAAD